MRLRDWEAEANDCIWGAMAVKDDVEDMVNYLAQVNPIELWVVPRTASQKIMGGPSSLLLYRRPKVNLME